MRPSTIALAALAGLVFTVSARDCTQGLTYCGYILLNIGKYRADIDQELYNKHIDGDDSHVKNSLFDCGDDGLITWKDFCSTGCHDGGGGHSDHC